MVECPRAAKAVGAFASRSSKKHKARTVSAALAFHPRDPLWAADPYPRYARLRQDDPVHRSAFGMWVLSRDADVRAALKDPRFSSRPSRFSAHARPQLAALPASRMVRDMVMFQDPPAHTRLRRLLARVIHERLGDDLKLRIARCVDELLAPHLPRGEIDLLHDLAMPLPVHVIADLLGIPPQDRSRVKTWAESLFKVFSPLTDESGYRTLNDAVQAFRDYLAQLVQWRRAHPQSDVISLLVDLHDDEGALSDDELITSCMLLFANGEETFAHALCNGVWAMLQQPAQWQRLVETPALRRAAFEESLRFDSPAQVVGRTLLEAVELHGRVMPQGVPVYLLLGSANRDPARWADPDRFEPERFASPVGADGGHVALGHGRHACLGAGIARAEAQVALDRVLDLLVAPEVVSDVGPDVGPGQPGAGLAWRPDLFLRGLQRLPLRFRPAACRA